MIQLLKKEEKPPKEETVKESNFRQIVKSIHNYKYAREPLNCCTSHFQILEATNTGDIYISLTNISSQSIRSTLISKTLEYLLQHWTYKFGKIWIQSGNQSEPIREYQAKTTQDVLEIITKAAFQTAHLMTDLPDQPPWYLQVNNWMTHIINPEPNAEVDPELQNFQVPQQPPQNKRKSNEQPSTSAQKRKNIIRSSYTKTTNETTGNQTEQRDQDQASSHSTTETTTTSSTEQQTNQMPQEQENELSNTWEQMLKDVQKHISQLPKLNYCQTSYSIVSVTVSEQSITMEIKS